MIKKDDLNQILDRTIGWIENCDTKASIVLGGLGIAISILFTFDYTEKILEILNRIFEAISFCNVLYLSFFFASLGILIYGGYCLFCVLIARTNTKDFSARGITTDSAIFFGSIASNATYQMYKDKLEAINDVNFEDDISSQIYICSLICQEKFKNYKKGLICSVGGFAMFILMLLIGMITCNRTSHYVYNMTSQCIC